MSLESIRQWRDANRSAYEDPTAPLSPAEAVAHGWWRDVDELLEIVDAGERLAAELAELHEAAEQRVVLMAERINGLEDRVMWQAELIRGCSCGAAQPTMTTEQRLHHEAAPGETDQRAALVKQLVDGLRPRSITEVHVNGEPLLAPAEHVVLELLGQVWNVLKSVGDPESLDMKELALHVHALQHAVMAQAAARAYPERYRLIGQPGAWRRYPEQASS